MSLANSHAVKNCGELAKKRLVAWAKQGPGITFVHTTVLEDIPATVRGRVLWQNINQKFIPGSSRKRTDDRSRFDHKHDEDESLDDDFGEDDDYGAITTNRSYQRRCFLSDGSFAFRDGQCRVKRYRLFKKSLRKRNLWPKMSSQEVAAYVAAAVAAAGAIVHMLLGRRGKKVDDKYP